MAWRINLGALSERVVLETRSETRNAYGHASAQWLTVTTLWASVRGTTLREREASGAVNAAADFVVTLQFRRDLADPIDISAWRLVWRGRPLNIRGVRDPDGMRKWLVVECAMGTNDG